MSSKRNCDGNMEAECLDSKRVKKSNALSMHDSQEIVALAKDIQNAQSFVRSNAYGKLSVIAEQIDFLQQQAMQVLEKARRDEELHKVSCNLQKIPGRVYYLYRNIIDNRTFFSIIAPAEWGVSLQHKYLGAFRLEADRSWTPEAQFGDFERRRMQCDRLFRGTNNCLKITDR